MARTFPPSWTYREASKNAFVVEDANGTDVAFVYFETEETRRQAAGHMMTRDEARRIAANIAKLPGLLTAKTQKSPADP